MTDPALTHFLTPVTQDAFKLSNEEKKTLIEGKVREILEILGLDINHPSINRTPFRIAKMYVDEIFSGIDPSKFPPVTFHIEELPSNEFILVKEISFISFCEHHLVPMVGAVHIAYLPCSGKVLGLSKLNRIVRYFAKRPQLQERLTAQIADSLSILLSCENVAVFVEAKHFCVMARGVEDVASKTETCMLRGAFEKDRSRRQEFFMRIGKGEKEWEDGKPDSVLCS